MKKSVKVLLITLSSIVGLAIIASLLAIIVYFGNSSSEESSRGSYDAFLNDISSSDMNKSSLYTSESAPSVDDGNGSYDIDQKIVKTGSASMLVSNIDKSIASLNGILDQYNGVILSSYDSGENNDRYVRLRFKVESNDFDRVMTDLLDIDGEIVNSQADTQDITEQYVDTQSRLKNLRSVEAQLMKILNDADTVTDTLAVYRELTSIRSQIEVYEGQIKYMDNQTDYSYITVTFSVNKEGIDISENAWKPIGEFKAALNAFVGVLKGLGNVFIWLVVFSPFILIPTGIVLVLNKRKKSK